MKSVGIIGAGISSLHLALFLQQQGVRTTVYLDKRMEEIRGSRIPNNVGRFGATRDRERSLRVDHWYVPGHEMLCAHVHAHVDPPIMFRGDLTDPASFVDFRIYLPALLLDYQSRGGEVVHSPVPEETLVRSAATHDLTVVAAGGRHYPNLFPRIPERSADGPSRVILAGLFHGVAQPDPVGLGFDIVPGAGEIFQSPVLSFGGRVSGITFEAIQGGPWEAAVRQNYYDDPARCAEVVLQLLTQADSDISGRIDRDVFRLTRPLDLLQGALTPTVRTPFTMVGESHLAVAVGDAAVLNDPVAGQGGNLGSASAFALGQLITEGGPFNQDFGQRWETRLDRLARPVTNWTNAALAAPPDHVIELLHAASKDQTLANAYLNNFNNPTAMWATIETPQATAHFIAQPQTPHPASPLAAAEAAEPPAAVRERRFVETVLAGRGANTGQFLTADSLLVTENGFHRGTNWDDVAPVAGPPGTNLTQVTTNRLADGTTLVTYLLETTRNGATAAFQCSTVWRSTSDGHRVIVHQQSAR